MNYTPNPKYDKSKYGFNPLSNIGLQSIKSNTYKVLPENNNDVLTKFNNEIRNMDFLNEFSAPMINKSNVIHARNLSQDNIRGSGRYDIMPNRSELLGGYQRGVPSYDGLGKTRTSTIFQESLNQQNKILNTLLASVESNQNKPDNSSYDREKFELELKIKELEKSQHMKSEMDALRLQLLMMSMNKKGRRDVTVERMPPPPMQFMPQNNSNDILPLFYMQMMMNNQPQPNPYPYPFYQMPPFMPPKKKKRKKKPEPDDSALMDLIDQNKKKPTRKLDSPLSEKLPEKKSPMPLTPIAQPKTALKSSTLKPPLGNKGKGSKFTPEHRARLRRLMKNAFLLAYMIQCFKIDKHKRFRARKAFSYEDLEMKLRTAFGFGINWVLKASAKGMLKVLESQKEDLNIVFSDKEKKPPPGEIESRMIKLQVIVKLFMEGFRDFATKDHLKLELLQFLGSISLTNCYLPQDFMFQFELNRLDFSEEFGFISSMQTHMIITFFLLIRAFTISVLLKPWEYNDKIPTESNWIPVNVLLLSSILFELFVTYFRDGLLSNPQSQNKLRADIRTRPLHKPINLMGEYSIDSFFSKQHNILKVEPTETNMIQGLIPGEKLKFFFDYKRDWTDKLINTFSQFLDKIEDLCKDVYDDMSKATVNSKVANTNLRDLFYV